MGGERFVAGHGQSHTERVELGARSPRADSRIRAITRASRIYVLQSPLLIGGWSDVCFAGHDDERRPSQAAACYIRSAKRLLTNRRTREGGLTDMTSIRLDKPDKPDYRMHPGVRANSNVTQAARPAQPTGGARAPRALLRRLGNRPSV